MHSEEINNRKPSSELYATRLKKEAEKRRQKARDIAKRETGNLTFNKAKNAWMKSKSFDAIHVGESEFRAQFRLLKKLAGYFSETEWKDTPIHMLENKLLQFFQETQEANTESTEELYWENMALFSFIRYINELQRKKDNAPILRNVVKEVRKSLSL